MSARTGTRIGRLAAALAAATLLVVAGACSSDDDQADEQPLEQPAEAKDLDAETCQALYDALDTLEGVPTGETEGLEAAQAVADLEVNLGASAPVETVKVGVQLINSAASPEEADATRQAMQESGGFTDRLDQLRTTVDDSCE
jgi:hypothetical protein